MNNYLPNGIIKSEFIFSQKEWKKIPISERKGSYEFYIERIRKSNKLFDNFWLTLYPDVERWIHYNEYVNGYKKETEHYVGFSIEHIKKYNEPNDRIMSELVLLWNSN